MSVSEAEVQMVDKYSKNIDMQDIGLFWQLTIKTIDNLKIVGNENLTLEMYIMQLMHLKSIDERKEVSNLENTSIKISTGDMIGKKIEDKPVEEKIKGTGDIQVTTDGSVDKFSLLLECHKEKGFSNG
jgi:DNA polymerase-3 subunit gamma/tau